MFNGYTFALRPEGSAIDYTSAALLTFMTPAEDGKFVFRDISAVLYASLSKSETRRRRNHCVRSASGTSPSDES